MSRKKAVYPGTFDPMTLGHLDVVERTAGIFEEVHVAVVSHPRKETMFTAEERLEMAREVVAPFSNVTVSTFSGLLVDYVRSLGTHVIVRGIRAYGDFEYEFQMTLTNRKIAPEIETLFMIPQEIYSSVSSSVVREIAVSGGDTSMFVPPAVDQVLRERFGEIRET